LLFLDKSIVLDVSNENTTMCYDNSGKNFLGIKIIISIYIDRIIKFYFFLFLVNMTQSTNNFDEDKEEIGTFQLKQSISEDSNCKYFLFLILRGM